LSSAGAGSSLDTTLEAESISTSASHFIASISLFHPDATLLALAIGATSRLHECCKCCFSSCDLFSLRRF
jgi:hypothetical protein